MNSVEEDESKRSLKYVQDRLKYLKLETAPKEILYALGMRVLGVKPKERTLPLLYLLKKMTEGNAFFESILKQYGDEIFMDILRFVYLEFVPEGEVLFEMESIGYEFFIILQGIVGIFVKISMSETDVKAVTLSENTPFPENPKSRSKSSFEGVPKSPPNVNSTVLRKTSGYHIMHRTVLLKGIKDLSDGGSFGEAALIKGKPATRNATAVCKTDCYFAVMDKENYERIIGEHQQRQLNEKISFLKRVPILRCMNTQDLATLNYFFEMKVLRYRAVVFNQGDELESVFVIKSGSIRIYRSEKTRPLWLRAAKGSIEEKIGKPTVDFKVVQRNVF